MKKSSPKSRAQRTRNGELPQIRVNNRGTAYINYRGDRHYLGRYGTPEERLAAEKERLRILDEYEANRNASRVRKADPTVAYLVLQFLRHAKTEYVKHGRSTGSFERFKLVSRSLVGDYGDFSVSEFGPKCLKVIRKKMVDAGLCRKIVNQRIGLIKQMFSWGVGEEIVDETVAARLRYVAGLREGKTPAPDYPEIESVDFETVEKTLRFCHPVLADMIRVQMYAGMRPQDVCNIRLCDIDMSGKVWEYAPWEHKTEHKLKKGKKIKVVRWLGPKIQEILASYVTAKALMPEAFFFSPADVMRSITLEKRMNRKTKVQPSQEDRSKPDPMINPGQKYTTGSYRTAIHRACRRAGVEKWSPNQLRHTWATYIEEKYGREAAQIVLGHQHPDTTEIYVDKRRRLAIEIALKEG